MMISFDELERRLCPAPLDPLVLSFIKLSRVLPPANASLQSFNQAIVDAVRASARATVNARMAGIYMDAIAAARTPAELAAIVPLYKTSVIRQESAEASLRDALDSAEFWSDLSWMDVP